MRGKIQKLGKLSFQVVLSICCSIYFGATSSFAQSNSSTSLTWNSLHLDVGPFEQQFFPKSIGKIELSCSDNHAEISTQKNSKVKELALIWGKNLADFKMHVTSKNIKPLNEYTGKCGLSEVEILAVLNYTSTVIGPAGGSYQWINGFLRNGPEVVPLDQMEIVEAQIELIKIALSKLTNFVGTVRRVVNVSKSFDPDKVFELGGVFLEKAFLSTTIDRFSDEYLEFNGMTKLAIDVKKNCHFIGPLSMNPQENEVLCMPNSRFDVVFNKKLQVGNFIYLKQVD